MVKKVIFAFILINLLGVLKVNALSISNLRMYYTDYNGDVYNTNSTSTAQWGGYYTTFINHNFGGGSMFDQPDSLYAFFNSGQGCSNKSCILTGVLVSKTENTYSDNTLSSVKVQLEQSGVYKNCSVIGLSTEYNMYSYLTFQCSSYNLNSGFNVNFSNFNAPTTTFIKYGISLNDFNIVESSTTDDVIVNDNKNTQNIINNNTQNSQNIINNQNSNTNQIIQDNQQNTQDIIDNQNQNTQQEIESQKVCTYIDKNYISNPNSYLESSGNVSSTPSTFGVTKYIPVNSSSIITPVSNVQSSTPYFCFYDINKSLIRCYNNNTLQINNPITIPSNSSFVRFTIRSDVNKPTFNICQSGNQALNDSLNGLNDTLNDTSQPNTNQDINDMNDMVASDTPISDLITMPLTLINAYINGVNSSCSPINLGNLYGTDLVFPCINLEQRLGSNLWHIIDSFFSIFMCYNIGMLFVTAFDGITSLRDDFEGLYQPRHADTGYQPKHGG